MARIMTNDNLRAHATTMAESLRHLARVLSAHEFGITPPSMLTQAADLIDRLAPFAPADKESK